MVIQCRELTVWKLLPVANLEHRIAILLTQDGRRSRLCAFTTDPTEAPLLRMLVEPTDKNGLSIASRSMIDKITTVPKASLGKRIGKLHDEDIVRLNRALMVFLGLGR